MYSASSNVRRNLLALLFSAGVVYGLGEIITRVFVPDPAFMFENRIEMFREDPVVGYRNVLNYRGYAQGFIRVETNNLGYRGENVPLKKGVKTFRILGLGDSITWGTGVQEEHTYLRILEGRLNQTLPPSQQR